VLSGDFASPSLLGTLKLGTDKIAGQQMVDAMNAVGVDLVTFGNHEFDLKEHQIQARIDESAFDWTSCNVLHRQEGNVAPWTKNGQPVPRYSILRLPVPDGADLRVGFVGVTLPFNQQDYVAYLDVDSAYSATVREIRDSCDVVLGITHLEMAHDLELAAKVPEVPLVLGGHDHTHMDSIVGPVSVTKADANAKTVYVHRITWHPATGKTAVNSTLVTIDGSIPFDPEAEAVVQKWIDIGDSSMRAMGYEPYEVVYATDDMLDGRESSIRYGQTNLGGLIVGAMAMTQPAADVAFFNSGSVRLDDQLTGKITQYDILRTLPYGGGLAYATVSGRQLAEVLEIGTVKNVGLGGYFQLSGAEKQADQWMVKGTALDPDGSYSIVLTDFLASGREANLEMLAGIDADIPEQVLDTLKNDIRDVLMVYLRSGAAQSTP
ncbi:MAG: bifunctional metallophosphatase/5'-nucleotidase, partial [Bacteroidota bacterium]